MPNNWFDFKQFRVDQSNAAFKVGTDGCILGAWSPINNPKLILDVGTGSGLISLLLAQRSSAYIDAVEIDPKSAQQAQFNFTNSPWADRLNLIEGDVTQMAFAEPDRYDLVISNPPYFKGSTGNADPRSTQARHETGLSLSSLLSLAHKTTLDSGLFSTILPKDREAEFSTLAMETGWYIQSVLSIRPKANRPSNRLVLVCQKTPCKPCLEDLIIYESDGGYTREFNNLMQPYYLYL